jgi:hypothetical protein
MIEISMVYVMSVALCCGVKSFLDLIFTLVNLMVDASLHVDFLKPDFY